MSSGSGRSVGLWWDAIVQARLVWRLLWDARVPWPTKLLVPATLGYIVFLIDLIPDFFLGLGQIDDLVILILGMRLFVSACPAAVVEEHLAELQGQGKRYRAAPGETFSRSPSSTPGSNDGQGPVIDASFRVLEDKKK